MLLLRKAQAAMEFLMTYGWAIMIVLVVIGALAYFGVLSPANLLPEKCTFPAGVACNDFALEKDPSTMQDTVKLVLQNGMGRDVLLRGATARGEALGDTGCTTLVLGETPDLSSECCPPGDPPCDTWGLGMSNGCVGGKVFRNGKSKTVIMAESLSAPTDYTCSFEDTGRDKNKYNITVFYSWLDSPGITHTTSGELLARKK